ncbi:MAG: LysM peptidoglycan-binding domain-containing protein [Limisphaerales bacterium]
MNTPNPLQPQGSLPAGGQGKSTLRITILAILAIHAAVLGGLLLQGCDKNAGTSGSLGASATPTNEPLLSDLPPLNPATNYYATDPSQFVSPPVGGPAGSPTNAYAGFSAAPSTGAVVQGQFPPAQPFTPTVDPAITGAGATADAGLAAGTDEPVRHKIARGETLGALAQRHGTSVRAIEALNPGVDSRRLKIGQEILLPAPRAAAVTAADAGAAATPDTGAVYTVRSGDNLLRISRKFGTTPKAIRALNGLKSDRILAGQKLKIPAPPPPATAAVPAPAPSTTPPQF